jgi:endonuclease YncB( thermonuclease family)
MRILSVLLGIAVIGFLLWPNMIPLGFSGIWWASQRAHDPPKPPPPAPAPEAIKAKPSAPPATHALTNPTEPPLAKSAPDKLNAEPLAAAEDPVKTGAVTSKAETKLYRRVMVRDGGTLEAEGAIIRLAGISAREADASCKDERGKNWPCGAAAKAALAKLIRTRAVTCTIATSGERNIFSGAHTILARCAVAGTDLSAWMVRQGWAEPDASDNKPALAEAAATAKKERLGFWQPAD